MKQISFTIEVARHEDGVVLLKDLTEEIWHVLNKDGSPLSESQFNKILAECYGFWDIAREFKLTRKEVV